MTSLLLQVKVEVKETKEQCEGLKNDLRSVSADLEASLTKKEEEPQILSRVKEQAAAADNDDIDGGASPSPAGGEKAVDSEQNGEAVPRVPPVRGEGGFHKSNAMLNSSQPSAMGTTKGETPRPQPPISYAVVVADGKPASSPLNKTSQQQPPSPSSSSCPAPTVSKSYCMCI